MSRQSIRREIHDGWFLDKAPETTTPPPERPDVPHVAITEVSEWRTKYEGTKEDLIRAGVSQPDWFPEGRGRAKRWHWQSTGTGHGRRTPQDRKYNTERLPDGARYP